MSVQRNGAAAVMGSVPLLGRSWLDVRRKERLNLFPFLTASCLLVSAAGAALTTVQILGITSIGLLLERYASRRAGGGAPEILCGSPPSGLLSAKRILKLGSPSAHFRRAIPSSFAAVIASQLTDRRWKALLLWTKPISRAVLFRGPASPAIVSTRGQRFRADGS